MKELKEYIYEGIFDEEDQIDDLDWVTVDFQTLINAKSEDEYNRAFHLLELKVKNEGGIVGTKGGWLPRENNKRYIFFVDAYKYIRYGTKSQSYYNTWNNTKCSNLQSPRGMRDYTHPCSTALPIVYYIPDSLKKSYNKAIKTIQ
jgi:hypothetical protein